MNRVNVVRLACLLGLLAVTGCQSMHKRHAISAKADQVSIKPRETPRELCKTTLPTYLIEPPDILDIEAVRLVPRSDYRLNTADAVRVTVRREKLRRLASGDSIVVRVPGAPAVAPLEGVFLVQPDGTVSLGSPYGAVQVAGLSIDDATKAVETSIADVLKAPKTFLSLSEAAVPFDQELSIEIDGRIDFGSPYGSLFVDGMTIAEARVAIASHFQTFFDAPAVTINLLQPSSLQQVVGEHLVGPDGTVSLGVYGSVSVVGLTLEQANAAIEARLSLLLDEPSVSTSVIAYNSKVYYVIAEGGGLGDGVFRFPVTGNDTVLDAVSLIQGLPQGSSYRMWVARPTPQAGRYVTMPIDWADLTSLAATETNYQLLPGDRLYIVHDPMLAFDNHLAKLLAPLERIAGFSILGAETATRLSGNVLEGGGNPRVNF